MENHTIVTLKKGEGRTLKAGGLWIYSNEIDTIAGRFKNGDVVTVRDSDGYPMGKGFINQNSKIRIRMMTRHAGQEINEAFLKMRIENAWNYRKTVLSGTGDVKTCEDLQACRVIFGEADFLPGLVVDKYADVLVIQCLALGMEQFKLTAVELLKQTLAADGVVIRGVYERSDANERKKEGLSKVKGFIGEPFDTNVEIVENGVHYMVDIANGQKTGFFLDQKYNRRAVARLAAGRTVLDCFTHTGSFALNAALGGAKRVTAVDVSASAVEMARANVERNGLGGVVDCVAANVFELLPALEREPKAYDFIILDPPAFTKSRRTAASAMTGYKEINYRAMRLLPRGGYLATCSCSHFAEEEKFQAMLQSAARDAGVRLRQIEARQQSCDHPILWGVEETNYLKFYLFQVV